MTEEIDDKNFSDFFFDTKRNKFKKGQVLARYAAIAEFVNGNLKKDVIGLLIKDKVQSAIQVMCKLGNSTYSDSLRICKEIVSDLCNGLSEQEVLEKTHKYVLEMYYYTNKECVPINDPHWSIIGLDALTDIVVEGKLVEKEVENEQ